MKIKDAENVRITDKGELLMKSSLGEIKEKAPVSFINDKQVSSSFRQNADGTIGFDVATQPGQTLRIDPAVVWSTYFGGSGIDLSYGCTYDGNGHIYLAGYSASSGLASGGYQNTSGGGNDALLAKFDSSGYLLWATYYGNTGDDQGYSCVTDGSGNVYLGGKTTSATGINTAGAAQTTYGGSTDAFLVKFNASGSRIWATYYGGSSTDQTVGAQSVAVDGSGNVFLSGNTKSSNNMAAGTGFQQTIGLANSFDAFLVKFDASGNRLWGTYYGGSGTEQASAIATDGSGNIYMASGTDNSTGLASAGAYLSTFPGGSALLVKFDANGGRLWATYYGHSSGGSGGLACATDAGGNVYMTGITSATSGIASTGSYQSTFGGANDAYIVKFSPTGSRLWGTYYGGSVQESAYGCSVDASGNVYICGLTGSPNVMGVGGFQSTSGGGNDAFIAQFNSSGTRIWGSYFGGAGSEIGYYCIPDAIGNVYMAGQSNSTSGISKPGTFQSAYGGGSLDAYLVKIGEIGLFTDSVSINLCTGAAVNVPYSLFGVYNSGNTFTAQLSNASGSFTNPVNIGTVTSTAAGIIPATIPANTPPGSGYRIRVISSSPVIIGTNNGTNLTIGLTTNPTVTLSVSPNDTICLGTPVTFTATASIPSPAFTYTWYKGNNPMPINTTDTFYTTSTVANNDTFIVKISNNGCAVPDYDSIKMTVNTPAIPTISVTVSPNDTICSNTAVTFTAIVTQAGTNVPVWYKNNNPLSVGSGLTYAPPAGTISNNDIFKAVLTSNGNCVSTVPVKDSIKMTVSPALTPSVVVTVSPNDTICAGTPVTFAAVPTNGSSSPAPTYSWYKNGTFVSTGISYTPAAGSVGNNDIYRVQMTVNDTIGCYSTTLVKDSIRMTVNPVVTPTVSVQVSPNDTVCTGTLVTCTAQVTGNGTATPTWTANGASAGTGGTYSFTATANTWVKATVTSNAACPSPATVKDSVLIVVNPIVTPAVSITANPGNSICAGQQVTFTASALNTAPGNTHYQWFKNGDSILINGTGSSYIPPVGTVNTNDTFYVIINSTQPCATVTAITSNQIIMTVNQNVVPGVNISVNAGSVVCAGTAVTFHAHTTNGGTPGNPPAFQWYVGTTPTGPNDSTFTVTPANGSAIHVVMTSSLACANPDSAISNTITMNVISQVTPTITLTSNPSDTACYNKKVTYTITAVSGFNPADSIIWRKGSNIVQITTPPSTGTYTDNTPDGSPVSVTLHTTLPCANAAYVTSTITLPVKACCDAPANLTKVGLGVNGGLFSWDAVPGAVGYEYNATQNATPPVTGQFTNNTSCIVSTLSPGTFYLYVRTYCGNGLYSPWVRIGPFATPTTGIHPVAGDDYTMMIYPNPVSDEATIEIKGGMPRNTTIQITDLLGRIISTTESADRKFNINMRDLASGMYLLHFNDGEHSGAVKINKL
jgi:hypothetical protein